MAGNFVKLWLAGILAFLPFQLQTAEFVSAWNHEMSTLVRYIDEITIILFLPLATGRLFRGGKDLNSKLIIILFPVLAVTASGIISGAVNGNAYLLTALGTFDYIKNFLVVFIYAAVFNDLDEYRRVFRFLLIMAACIGAIALIQELSAATSLYLLADAEHGDWRLGLFRASSLMHHPNSLGLYSVLILAIYLFTAQKVRPILFIPLFIGIFTSVSRMAYAAFLFLGSIQLFSGRRWFIIPLTPVCICLFFMSSYDDFNITALGNKQTVATEDRVFREYARNKALEIWQDNPVTGVGPGMFGGVVSLRFNSPVYDKYNFSQKWFDFMKPFRSIDQFWPQLLAEMGIAGVISFVCLLLSLLIFLYRQRLASESDEIRGAYAGLMTATASILIYLMGSGLNYTAFLFTCSAITGMIAGSENPAHKQIPLP